MINQLKDKDKSVTLTAKIEQIYPQNAYEGVKTVQNCFISDDTGKIKLTLWDKPEVPKEDTGKVISIKNGYVTENTWKGRTSLNLQAGKYSYLAVEDEPGEKDIKELMDTIDENIVEPMTGFQKDNILKIMDEIIRHLQERRAEIAEM